MTYHVCVEMCNRSNERLFILPETIREAGELLAMWERRVLDGEPVPPVRWAIAAPATQRGPTLAEMLKAKYQRNKVNGRG